MRLYVCWGTFRPDREHPCGEAHEALVTAGYEPEVVKTGGCYRTDPPLSKAAQGQALDRQLQGAHARLIRRRNLEAMGDFSESMTRCSTTELRATRARMDARKAERVEARDEQARRYLACHESEADWQDDESERR